MTPDLNNRNLDGLITPRSVVVSTPAMQSDSNLGRRTGYFDLSFRSLPVSPSKRWDIILKQTTDNSLSFLWSLVNGSFLTRCYVDGGLVFKDGRIGWQLFSTASWCFVLDVPPLFTHTRFHYTFLYLVGLV